jgi:tRNA(Arg) A34 adenosine deaminase TadA
MIVFNWHGTCNPDWNEWIYLLFQTMKVIILLAVVMCGAYAQHNANHQVNEINKARKHLKMFRTDASDETFMQRAIALSQVASEASNGYLTGSVVVLDGKVIGEGSDKVNFTKGVREHAEAEAVRNACKEMASCSLKGCSVYCSVKPCTVCIALFANSGIEKVYYRLPGGSIAQFNGSVAREVSR